MAQIDWQSIMNGQSQQQKKRYHGASVKFFNAYNKNEEKSLKEGRPIFDEIPSISIRYPGMDETVRRIEQRDIQEYPELYAAFMANNTPVEEGTPLSEWPPMNGSALRELQYMGFKTVEQLAAANDDVKRRLGTLGKFVKMAKDWLDASTSTQADIMKLKSMLEREQKRTEKLTEQLELLMQRVEANEGTSMKVDRTALLEPEPEIEEVGEVQVIGDQTFEPRRRGRPRKE